MEEESPFKDVPEFFDDIRWAPCSFGRVCSFLMMPFVIGIIGLTYIPYTAYFGSGGFGGIACLVIFHVLLLLLLASYFQAVFTDPGTVPAAWNAKVSKLTFPAYKKCRYSSLYRPLRSHYCSVTRRPVLNLDHFCPWVANAVGFKNRKFFILFCFYGMLTAAFAAITLGPHALGADRQDGENDSVGRAFLLMAFIMDVTFAIALSLFSMGHFYLAYYNQTSLEDYQASKRYDCGWRSNLCSVFGNDPRFWLLPTHYGGLFGDGVHWKLNDGGWDGQAEKEAADDTETKI